MIVLEKVKEPKIETEIQPVLLSDETIHERKRKLLEKMEQEELDTIIVYADLEHGSNFEYLCGFLPRFEEALLVLHSSGEAFMVLGNENLNKASKARIKAKAIHMPHLSLPNQPMDTEKSIPEILAQCQLQEAKKIGIVGWKYFTSKVEDTVALFDIPHFLLVGIKDCAKDAALVNATHIFIGNNGVRLTNTANEIAHYEYGAALAGNCILEAMNAIEVGKTEMEIANHLDADGQRHSVVTILAAGERFIKANMYPSKTKIESGDRLSITTGFKGGLQSRSGYAVHNAEELPLGEQDYLEMVAKPYFQAIVTWLQAIKIGVLGATMYETIEEVLPKERYGWHLNPGHLCADEEWLASPIYPNSKESIKSGMLFQTDIIPSVTGYNGASCEGGIVLADATLRKELQEGYPELWKRFQMRRDYLQTELGILLPEEVLPMSSATVYYRPFMLAKDRALKVL